MDTISTNALHFNLSKCLLGLIECLLWGESMVILSYQSDIFTNREIGEQGRLSRNLTMFSTLFQKPLDVFVVLNDGYSD